MSRRPKLMIGTVVVLLMVGVYGTSAAKGAEFHSPSSHITKVFTKTNLVMTTTAGQETCGTAEKWDTVEGATSWKTTQISGPTVTTGGGGGSEACHMIIFGSKVTATMSMNGCDYIYNSDGSFGFTCPEGKQVEMFTPGCTTKVGSQSIPGSVSYTNNGNHIDISVNVSSLKYSHAGFVCGTGSGSNGTLVGTETASAINKEEKAVKIWWE